MEKKRARRRRDDDYVSPNEQDVDKPNKAEYNVAKWMKKNLKVKKTKFLNHNVEYFTANRAVDALLKSQFAEGNEPLFKTREQVIEYLDIMLEHKFFHRARKIPVNLDELNPAAATAGPAVKKEEVSKEREEKKEKLIETKSADNDTERENGNEKSAKEKKKRKIRLEMHHEQVFVDGPEAYVWIYDPIPMHYWIYGFILMLGAIVICLFPLWPQTLRKGVYHLSVAAAGFLVFILGLTVLRLIIFTICWILTAGKLHFWLLPNLTEDVGFFASFWPLYESKYVTSESNTKEKRSKSKSKKTKEKHSDNEDERAEPVDVESTITPTTDNNEEQGLRNRKPIVVEDINTGNCKSTPTTSESESEISGKDYEIINRSEVQNLN